ncbi:MAG: hypothetical protein KME29_01760 [Calothrix sp. FI2-JRJ7]|nr:hypothetical protein [Calothrix sp. FI2-JRJ7]
MAFSQKFSPLTTEEPQGQYFFKQKEVEARIIEYIRNLPDCSDEPEVLQLDSEAVLKSIEAQHGLFVERARGIYSFSHLTFHEYFTARKIKEAGNDKMLHMLAACITDKRWREVFLLTVGMLDDAEKLLQLMKQQIDGLLAGDEKLQQFLTWAEEKSKTVTAPYKPFVVRAYYLNLAQSQYLVFDRNLPFDLEIDFALDRDLALIIIADRDLDRGFAFNSSQRLDFTLNFAQYLDFVSYQDCEDELKRKLLSLKNELPNQTEDFDIFKQWWILNGASWIERLRTIMIKHRNIGHDWKFTDSQYKLLEKYHRANLLLIECLNSDCYVSRDVRKYIEDTLILPIKSIPPARFE